MDNAITTIPYKKLQTIQMLAGIAPTILLEYNALLNGLNEYQEATKVSLMPTSELYDRLTKTNELINVLLAAGIFSQKIADPTVE